MADTCIMIKMAMLITEVRKPGSLVQIATAVLKNGWNQPWLYGIPLGGGVTNFTWPCQKSNDRWRWISFAPEE